jgi:hypothetical protein
MTPEELNKKLASQEVQRSRQESVNMLAAGQSLGQVQNRYDWTKQSEDQLIVYLRSSGSLDELAEKMKLQKHEILYKLREMSYERKEFAELKRVLK